VASFGVRLKQEREKRAVTLDDISLATKISTRMLRALEEEHFDQLPGGIFNKGFIRAYARCVGLDEEQAIADYLAAINPPGKSEIADQPPILEPPPREQNPTTGLPWSRFALVLLLGALALAAWGYYSRELQNRITNSTPPPAAAPAVKPQAEPSAPPPPATSATPTNGTAKPSQTTVASNTSSSAPSSASSSAPSDAGSQPSPAPSAPPASTPNQSSSPTPHPARLRLLIKAHDDYSWLSISVDGEIVTRSILIAPSQKLVRAEKEIIIKAGNVGALDFEFNGQKLPAQGGYGEVKTLTFDATGFHLPTPKPQEPAQLP
jgi:cytoskeleton protein RodZ